MAVDSRGAFKKGSNLWLEGGFQKADLVMEVELAGRWESRRLRGLLYWCLFSSAEVSGAQFLINCQWLVPDEPLLDLFSKMRNWNSGRVVERSRGLIVCCHGCVLSQGVSEWSLSPCLLTSAYHSVLRFPSNGFNRTIRKFYWFDFLPITDEFWSNTVLACFSG